MSVSDPIADMLTRIRNAVQVKHKAVSVPSSSIKLEIANILKSEGFVSGFQVEDETSTKPTINVSLHYWNKSEPAINGLKRVSTPGLRVYVKKDEMPRVYGDRGIAVISTNQGVMSGEDARKKGLGGEVLFYVW
jgi:small subunit ribosomal protein S8|tara:strand:- start:118 stop:519 length:402 start_codon:yes stop_codon:yes gene_type:complete